MHAEIYVQVHGCLNSLDAPLTNNQSNQKAFYALPKR